MFFKIYSKKQNFVCTYVCTIIYIDITYTDYFAFTTFTSEVKQIVVFRDYIPILSLYTTRRRVLTHVVSNVSS